MPHLPRPPADMTPATFFEEWLPAQAAKVELASNLEPMLARVALTGEGGGVWDLRVSAGGVETGPGGTEPADISLSQTVQDWRAILLGEEGAPRLAPEGASPADLLLLDASAQQMLKQVQGTLRFEVTEFKGRTWSIDVTLGKQPPKSVPDATITVGADTYAKMLARELPPAQAFFNGAIRLSGDTNLAMQLGMAMMPRFS